MDNNVLFILFYFLFLLLISRLFNKVIYLSLTQFEMLNKILINIDWLYAEFTCTTFFQPLVHTVHFN